MRSGLPANRINLVLNGGSGNDVILGSHGNDTVNGGAGNDVAALGDGNDLFIWNLGDGSDTVDGQGGFDRWRSTAPISAKTSAYPQPAAR